MRVLMTADTVGGVWTYALDLARGLAPAGVEVLVAAMGGRLSGAQRAAAAELPNVELRVAELKLEWMHEPWEDVARAGAWLLDLARAFDPDIVHVNGYAHAALPWGRPVVAVAHSCVVSWWRAVHGCEPPAAWRRYARQVARGLRAANAVVAPTRAMLDEIVAIYGTANGGIANGGRGNVGGGSEGRGSRGRGDPGGSPDREAPPETSFFETDIDRAGERAGAPIAGRVIYNGRFAAPFFSAPPRPYVFSAGRMWDEAKNLAVLDECAAGLPWPVYVAGATASPARRSPAPSGRGRGPRAAIALGLLPPAGVANWLAQAPIYALPARYEPFGLSALEAALSGCCLVLGDIPSLREVWADAAVFVPPDDAAGLRDALRELIADDARRDALAARARARAPWFTVDRMARGYLDLYAELGAAPAGDRSCASPCFITP